VVQLVPLVHAAALSVLDPGWFGPLRARRWPQRNCECEAGCCARQLRRRRYRLQRGLVLGNAELDRAPKPDAHYVPHLQGQVACMTMLDTASQGRLDAAGIAPERHAVRRRGRDTCAASFQREAGKIKLLRADTRTALAARRARPLELDAATAGHRCHGARALPGRSQRRAVRRRRARGDADVWTCVVDGIEMLGDRPALKLVREPCRLCGLRAKVWLDPAEHHLAPRAVQSPTGGGPALEQMREAR